VTSLAIYPDQKVVIAWLQNSDDCRDWPMFKVAAPFLLEQNEPQSKPKRTKNISSARWT